MSNSPDESINIGKKIGSCLKGGEIIAFKGGLGAGKTTFTRGLVMGTGMPDEVTSPTFTLVNEYRGRNTSKNKPLNLYHFDMYRINGIDDLETTGFYDYIDDNNVIIIEWSERILDALPKDTIIIEIERIDENKRCITLFGGEQFADIGD